MTATLHWLNTSFGNTTQSLHGEPQYGDSEEVVGRALKGRRDHVVLATKFGRPVGAGPNQQGASRRWIITAVENSLRRLHACQANAASPRRSTLRRGDAGGYADELISLVEVALAS